MTTITRMTTTTKVMAIRMGMGTGTGITIMVPAATITDRSIPATGAMRSA